MQLRDYQQAAVDKTWEYLCSQSGSPVIVMPTGSGKSPTLAHIAKQAIERFNGRVLVVAHRKELLEQNAEKLRACIPDIPIGIYSAGLRSRNTDHAIICCGIQSVYNKAHEFGARHLVIIDEVHLVPSDGEGMYRTFLESLRCLNPRLRMVGLTATPFRTGEGEICGAGNLFQSICYEVDINYLINNGYLCKLTTTPADATLDTSKLHIRAGEFIPSEVVSLFDDSAKVDLACREIVEKTRNRKSVLVFCSGVFHAQHVKNKIEELTQEECGLVTSETPSLARAATLDRFKRGIIRFTANVDVLTTGFDNPRIDAIAILRATASPGLFAQIVGRGLRTHPDKTDALVLDFGENIKRHGPLDASDFGRKRKESVGGGEVPSKTCPSCGEQIPASCRECDCGFLFPDREIARHESKADNAAILAKQETPKRWLVEEVRMSRHTKRQEPDGIPTLRVDYLCREPDGNLRRSISEWVCLEHEGYAQAKAFAWWGLRSIATPASIDDAVSLWKRGAVATPTAVTVKNNGKWDRIIKYELDPRPDEWEPEPEEADDVFDEEMEVPF